MSFRMQPVRDQISAQEARAELQTLTLAFLQRQTDVPKALQTLELAPQQTEKIIKMRIDILLGFTYIEDETLAEMPDDRLFQPRRMGNLNQSLEENLRVSLELLEPHLDKDWAKTRRIQIERLKLVEIQDPYLRVDKVQSLYDELVQINSRNSCLIAAQMLSAFDSYFETGYFGRTFLAWKALSIIERSNDPVEIALCRARKRVVDAADLASWYTMGRNIEFAADTLKRSRHPAVRTRLLAMERDKEFEKAIVLLCKIMFAGCYEKPSEAINETLIKIAALNVDKALVIKLLLRAVTLLVSGDFTWFNFEYCLRVIGEGDTGYELDILRKSDVKEGLEYLQEYFLKIDPLDPKQIVPIGEFLYRKSKLFPDTISTLFTFLNRYPSEPHVLAFKAKLLMIQGNQKEAMECFEQLMPK